MENWNEHANKLQAVLNTLNHLTIQSEHDTMLQILGCQNILMEERDFVQALPPELLKAMQEGKNGNDHAE